MTSVGTSEHADGISNTSSIEQQQPQQEVAETKPVTISVSQTSSTPSTANTTPSPTPTTVTRIPHPAFAPFQRSAAMRLRLEQQNAGTELTGTAGSVSSHLNIKLHARRNRSCSYSGHKTSQTTDQNPIPDEAHALCSATQCLALAESKESQHAAETDNNMAASKTRNMSLELNGGSKETTSCKTATLTANGTSKSPKTPATTALTTTTTTTAGNEPHSCVRQAHCGKHHQRSTSTPTSKLSTVHETKVSPKTPPVTPDSPSTYLDDDLDSMYSFATTTSGRSTMSCEHPYVARNGTTFSGRKMKYVVHCSNYAGQVGADYLTPTQRAQRQIRRLKELLCIARQDLEHKDTEMLRLTREVVELRLFKASLSSPEERSASSDAVTVREAELKTSQDVSPIVDMVDEAKCSPRHLARQQQQQQQLQTMQMSAEMQSSYADSGHFEDLSSVHSKDSQTQHEAGALVENCATPDAVCVGDSGANSLENYELQRQELIRMYEQRIEELIRTQDSTTSDLKRSHNDKVEALLQKLAECNTRYADIVPDYEHAKERIRELEKQLEELQRKLMEHEDKQNKMYLHMYQQGQEAERITRADQALELVHRQPDSKVSINELLHQLQSTQDELENIRTIYRRLLEAQKNRTHVDPEVTLQFLKSAVYYFLTDKENSQGHLQAIESILEFTEAEKKKISQARSPK